MEAGRSRGNHWSFWKDNVGIFEPSKGEENGIQNTE